MELADMVKETRRVLNVSQKQYAEDIGTNQTAISFIERGFIPGDDLVIKIVAYYEEVKGAKI